MSSHGCLIGIWLEIAFDCGLGLCGIFIIVIFVLDFNGTGMDLSIWVSGCQAWLYGELSVFGGQRWSVKPDVWGRRWAWAGGRLGDIDGSKGFIKLWQSLCCRGWAAEWAWRWVLVWGQAVGPK